MSCHCGSDQEYQVCCQPFHKGAAWPETAEGLMRARYSAFCAQEIDFLVESCVPEQRDTVDLPSVKRWAEQSEWQGLEIESCEAGLADDDTGVVNFIARFKAQGKLQEHKERAQFCRVDEKWYFKESVAEPVQTFVRENKKIGRNEPCPCGSGKKHKKCCG